jgi:putative transcriptional regulator
MDYGKALRALREKLLITQTELAQKLGVSYASVNRWENGKCEPTMKAKRNIRSICIKQGIILEEK